MSRRPIAWFALAASLGMAVYLAGSQRLCAIGFPLDDAWIHQTYARNLALSGQWAFVAGQPSAGSTAPLWTLLLAGGYWLGLEYHIWTYGLGFILLCLLAWLSYRLTRVIFPGAPAAAGWGAGLAVALEWHLLWAAGSGMETLLLAVFALAVFLQLMQGPNQTATRGYAATRAWLLGLIVGLSVTARPDGLTLLPVAAMGLALQRGKRERERVGTGADREGSPVGQLISGGVQVGMLTAGFALVFSGYLIFNRSLGGDYWPNTLYAKQTEYAALLQAPLPLRLLRQWGPPLVGGVALLVPGLLLALIQDGRQHTSPGRWCRGTADSRRRSFASSGSVGGRVSAVVWWLPLIWAAVYVALYALRLPVTYQHGRYVVPVIPVLVVYGIGGMAGWLRLNSRRTWRRVVSRAWLLSVIGLWMAFVVAGAVAYARDVAIIESEMVATARWLARQTAPDDRIAAHDIGAIGYFAGRPLLDLAGLVSPAVIPFMRDESRLAAWLDEQGADYLVTFPGWYPGLTSLGVLLYTTGSPISPAAGGENMQVLRWADSSEARFARRQENKCGMQNVECRIPLRSAPGTVVRNGRLGRNWISRARGAYERLRLLRESAILIY